MAVEALSLPKIRVRGRSFLALIVAPEAPLAPWFSALDDQLRSAGEFFAERPVVADLSVVGPSPEQRTVLAMLDGLAARDLRLIGAEGIDAAVLAGTRWERLPTVLHGRERDETEVRPAGSDEPSAPPPAPMSQPSLLIDRPVRSGQSVVFEEGDIVVVGSVASGAEVIAGGSIHVYGALRGRAIAGLRSGPAARIFCRKMEAEMVAVDQLYRTAEHWGSGLHGCAVQVRYDRASLRISALD